MAALMGDVFTDTPRFHDRMHSQHSSHYQSPSHSSSSPLTTTPSGTATRPRTTSIHNNNNPQSRPTPSPRRQASATATTPILRYASSSQQGWTEPTPNTDDAHAHVKHQQQYQESTTGGASRFPSPPSSASPNRPVRQQQQQQHGVHDTSSVHDTVPTPANGPSSASSSTASSTSTAATVIPADHSGSGRGIPSPGPNAGSNTRQWRPSHRTVPSNGHLQFENRANTPTGRTPVYQQAHQLPLPPQPKVIKIRDLHHIQTLVSQDGHPLSAFSGASNGMLTDDPPLQQMRYEISGMPISDIIEMVAALLTKITTTNDLQHDALQRNQVHMRQAEAQARHQEERQRREKEGEDNSAGRGRAGSTSGGTGGTRDGAEKSREVGHSASSGTGHMSPLSSSVLAFHGKNVPAITILSYLTRIHKYCPTTYEVFLSLLVYFDRMTERVNDMVVKSEEERRRRRLEEQQARQARIQEREKQATSYEKGTADDPDVPMRDTPDDDKAHDSDETDSDLADDDDDEEMADEPRRSGRTKEEDEEEDEQATYFVVDSFNIHRLIIAGVTCASKFFSDVFYTNSRYAKVGGLPLPELNHLELQFLLLNDFRLAVPVEDLEAYATMLVEFYAREVVAQTTRGRTSSSAAVGSSAAGTGGDGVSEKSEKLEKAY